MNFLIFDVIFYRLLLIIDAKLVLKVICVLQQAYQVIFNHVFDVSNEIFVVLSH